MKILVNGQSKELDDDVTLVGLLKAIEVSNEGIAIAVNDRVIPRSAWSGVDIQDGDRVEVIHAVQGG